MTSPYRALCDELKDAYAWCLEECMRVPAEEDTLIQRARAALAQPEPEGPSDWDLKVIMDSVGGPQFDSGPRWMLPFARAVLARYGGSTSNPTEA
jgi:hypothetical protein